MRSNIIRVAVFALFLCPIAAAAQAQVCIRIDESHDTLSQKETTARPQCSC